MRYLTYLIKETAANVWEYRSLSVVALATSTLSILCVGLFLLVYVNVHGLAKSLQRDMKMMVYLYDDLAPQDVGKVEVAFREFPEVGAMTFISQEEAIASFLKAFPSEEAILSGLGDAVLPASFVLDIAPSYQTPEALEALARRIQTLNGVEVVEYGKEWIRAFWWGNHLMVIVGVAVGVTLVLASIAVVSNTIRLTLASRRDETAILRLIGASEPFVKGPFLFEGMGVGVLGAALSIGVLKISFDTFTARVGEELGNGYHVAFLAPDALFGLLGGGMLLGLCGGLLALRACRERP